MAFCHSPEIASAGGPYLLAYFAGLRHARAGGLSRALSGAESTNDPPALEATVFELQGEKIRRVSDYWDMVTFLKQVGVNASWVSKKAKTASINRPDARCGEFD